MASISAAAASGDELRLLKAMRARLAAALDDENCHPRDLAAITRRLQEVSKQIVAVEERAKLEGGTIDEAVDDDDWTADDL